MEKIEPLRARRIRDRYRIFQKALKVVALDRNRPLGIYYKFKFDWIDENGINRKGITTWEDLFEFRKIAAHHRMNNMTPCSGSSLFQVGSLSSSLPAIR